MPSADGEKEWLAGERGEDLEELGLVGEASCYLWQGNAYCRALSPSCEYRTLRWKFNPRRAMTTGHRKGVECCDKLRSL